MHRTTTFCIIGLGRAGRFHLTSIQQLSSCFLKYVVDPGLDPNDPIVQQNDFQLIKEVEPALNDPEIDAVIVSPPTQFHYQYITQALKAGKHVFTEKPLGKTTEEIEQCYALAEVNGLALYLGFQRRYDQNFNALKDSLPKIGQIRTIKISFS